MGVGQSLKKQTSRLLREKHWIRIRRESYRSDRGSIESSMVIVPLVLLFLTGMQIAVTTHTRNIEKMHAQDGASVRGISGEFLAGDQFIHIDSSGDGQNLDLIISHREKSAISFLPNLERVLGRSAGIAVDGIAVVENRR